MLKLSLVETTPKNKGIGCMKELFVAVERGATKLACNEERGHEVGAQMSLFTPCGVNGRRKGGARYHSWHKYRATCLMAQSAQRHLENRCQSISRACNV